MVLLWAHLTLLVGLCPAGPPTASVGPHAATLGNSLIRVSFDLSSGRYDVADLATGATAVAGAHAEADGIRSCDDGLRRSAWVTTEADALGTATVLSVRCAQADGLALLLEFRVYPTKPCLVLRVGIENATDVPVHVHVLSPLVSGVVYPAHAKRDVRTLNGPSGANQTEVTRGPYRSSPNNVLMTFNDGSRRRSVVLGGLRTEDFPKYAAFRPTGGMAGARRRAIAGSWPAARLAAYLDCGEVAQRDGQAGTRLRVTRGTPFVWTQAPGDPQYKSIAFDYEAVEVSAYGLDPTKHYALGFSWWDYDANGRIESVKVARADGMVETLVDRRALPDYLRGGEGPSEFAVRFPTEAYADGRTRILFTNEGGISNAVVSEVWLWELDEQPSVPRELAEGRPVRAHHERTPPEAHLEAVDPVGKLVGPGVLYLPRDSFYVDVATSDPFAALEQYGRQLGLANGAAPRPYDFPTVCAWYTGVWNTPGAQNNPSRSKYGIATTAGLVEEMVHARESGFLRYSRVAGRIVPDNYTENNPQGWWDDEHWQREGFYVHPYETSRKWGTAMQALGCLAFTYFQPSGTLHSLDFRETHRELLLGQDVGRNLDYTNPRTQEHLRRVFAEMRGGISGMMFDYCDNLWLVEASGGGFADPEATSANFYRTIFRLAKEGLGPASWLHERALLEPSADLAIGLVDSQRTSGDTDKIDPAMVARSGLRWYKNRVVLAYDMDSKELHTAWQTPGYSGSDRDGRRMLLTMAYVAASRLLLATSFRDMGPEVLHDLSRTFPYHTEPRSATPLDAFVSDTWPQVYAFEISPDWHQLTLYNCSEPSREQSYSIRLAGERATGAVGLDPAHDYYVYDFWNDRFVGRVAGGGRLEQVLRPGEARVLSLHKVQKWPQFISTNRHIMQGYVDMLVRPRWDASRLTLTGTSRVVGGETYRVVLALNGYRPVSASEGCKLRPLGDGLAVLDIDRPRNTVVRWTARFARGVPD